MMRIFLRSLRLALFGVVALNANAKEMVQQSIFDFSFEDIDGSPYPLAQHRGKVIVLINTATECGFASQLGGMQKLWESVQGNDVVVISVPSNDFNDQEPRSNADIKKHCEQKFSATYPIVGKTNVRNYDDAHAAYRWIADMYGKDQLPDWNFDKFVFDRNGLLVEAFSSITGPEADSIAEAIETGLAVKVKNPTPAPAAKEE
jgi:glutathione peroxidase